MSVSSNHSLEIRRGQIWMVNFDPIEGREQGGIRPALIVSVDEFNNGPAGLVSSIPITTTPRNIPFHIEISPERSGLPHTSYIMVDNLRAISKNRLMEVRGHAPEKVLEKVEDVMRVILNV